MPAMTDLQTSLMIIGGTIVVAVISYNKWQEYKAKKSVERAFSSTHDDVLMTPHAEPAAGTGQRFEPTLDADSEAVQSQVDASPRAQAPVQKELVLHTNSKYHCLVPKFFFFGLFFFVFQSFLLVSA